MQDKGLGDTIARFTKATGIKKMSAAAAATAAADWRRYDAESKSKVFPSPAKYPPLSLRRLADVAILSAVA